MGRVFAWMSSSVKASDILLDMIRGYTYQELSQRNESLTVIDTQLMITQSVSTD